MGGRKETVSDAEILQEFLDADQPVLGTNEVADTFEFSNPGMSTRLYQLEDQGHLNRKQVGNINVWWISDAGEEFVEDQLGSAEE